MFTILTAAAVAAVAGMLGGWAGHRLGTRRMAILQTAPGIAVRAATADQPTGLADRRASTRGPDGGSAMSATATAGEHLLSVFGTGTRVEQLEAFLRTVARHHTELAEHLRGQLDAGGFEHPHSLITPAGARQLASIHDASAATATAMADTIAQALDLGTEDDR